MAGILTGLKSLGLENLENSEIFAEEESSKVKTPGKAAPKKFVSEVYECDLIYDKELKCPVCDKKFVTKIMKSSRAKLVGADEDLRPKYQGIDSQKYDVVLCEKCGYAALNKSFNTIMPSQIKQIKENVCDHVQLTEYDDPIYSYEQAEERYKLALACAVVKRAKVSEKALICLKSAWLYRGHRLELDMFGEDEEKLEALEAREIEYLENAYRGFLSAREKEPSPIAGMDTATLDYLLAELAFKFSEYDNSLKFINNILQAPNSERVKNKARSIKEKIVEIKKPR